MNQATYAASNPAPQNQTKIVVNPKSSVCIEAEDATLDATVEKSDLTFCGTDNGLVKLTETVAFGYERLNFHWKL
ncbi:hypothetical protein [Parasitella parasitica]|uniref:Uncharacterized protein n=1 Tax=Parasitella parasitica TaxID=35722 RepID=A0A0B7N718_9FUNG|nr:hypothetical protein [Parasitella parasitica]